ncbi:hypothetical protein UFOVP499_25 [uncultured Caudovirales phage]|uniref:Uncharacterized protein n=1 Tax=uncultured Caudovirales phage TaxID=2100421 RepID=A0A6J5MMH4_9CAUD|nr:hypothetical protein UFOVP499_25 [uncultured Caudovirales phage]
MTNEQANRILDRAKEGQQFSPFVIDRALALTGDIDPDRSTGMDKEVQEENEGRREKGSVLLVANNSGRHNQETRPESGRRIAGTHERIEGTK